MNVTTENKEIKPLASISWNQSEAFTGSISEQNYLNLPNNTQVFSADSNGVSWNGGKVIWNDENYVGYGRLENLFDFVKTNKYTQIPYSHSLGNGAIVEVYVRYADIKNKSYDEFLDTVVQQLNGATFKLSNTGKIGWDFGMDAMINSTPDYHLYVNDNRRKKIAEYPQLWEALGYDTHSIYDVELTESFILSDDLTKAKCAISSGTKTVYLELTQDSKNAINSIINDNAGMLKNNETLTLSWVYDGVNCDTQTITLSRGDMSLRNALEIIKRTYDETRIAKIRPFYTKLARESFELNKTYESISSYSYDYTQPTLVEREKGSDEPEDEEDNESEEYDQLQLWIQSGSEVEDGMYIKVDNMDSDILGIKDISVLSRKNSTDSITKVKEAINKVSSMRSNIGAQQNRLEYTFKNVTNIAENTQDSESLIRDTDMAKEMVENSKLGILEQVGATIMAQANQTKQGVLKLIQ